MPIIRDEANGRVFYWGVDMYVLKDPVTGARQIIPTGGYGERMRDRLISEGWEWVNRGVYEDREKNIGE